MTDRDRRKRLLTPHQRRALRDYQRILEAAALNPDRALDFAEYEPTAVTPILRSMTDQVVRSEVIFEYTMVDVELDFLIYRHFFGVGKRLQAARRTRRYKTLRLLLQNLYLLQKLAVVRSFKAIPKKTVSKIGAINDLRNGLAHTFFTGELPPSKRTYKGVSIFTRKGLEAFRADTWEIRCFFNPWLRSLTEEEGGGAA